MVGGKEGEGRAFEMKNASVPLMLLVLFIALFPQRLAAEDADDCAKAREWYERGVALSNSSSEEIACYQRAIELCPQDAARAHERLGMIYKARGELDLAIEELQQACKGGASSEPHTNLGEVYRMQGEYELAIHEFQTALDIREDDRRAQANLEYLYRRMGRDDFPEDEKYSMIAVPMFGREPGFSLSQGITSVDLNLESMTVRREWIAPMERPVDIWRLTCGIRSGLTNDLMVGVIPKLLWKKVYIRDLWGHESQPAVYGLGDTMVLLKYCLWHFRQTAWSISLGLSLPTGDEHKTSWYGTQQYSIPLGSGRYEFMPGVAFSTSLRHVGYLHANAHYFLARRRESGLDPGDELSYNLALCHPISLIGEPYFFSLPVKGLVGEIELNGSWRGQGEGPKAQFGPEYYGTSSKATFAGGNMLSWACGLQLLGYGNMKIEIGVQVPALVPDHPWSKRPVYRIGWTRFFPR